MTASTEQDLLALGEGRYVLLTTYRRSGVGVPTPVWVVEDGGELLVTTRARSGKVLRVRNDPRVELLPCDIRGNVPEGARSVPAVATIDDGASTRARIDELMEAKYTDRFRHMRSVRPDDVVSTVIRLVLAPLDARRGDADA